MEILTPDQISGLRAAAPDLGEVGKRIYRALRAAPAKKNFEGIVADKWYAPAEVAEILSVSYNTALRTMERMKRAADFASPRARKRLLRVKGSDLREYLRGKSGK